MTSNETVADLITRLSEAKEGSRELDAEIGAALRIYPSDNPPPWVTNWPGPFVAHPDRSGLVALGHSNGEIGMNWRAEPVTTSVDAILALIEKRLPGALFRVERMGVTHADAFGAPCWATCGEAGKQEQGVAETPPLALCVALLSALHVLSGEGE